MAYQWYFRIIWQYKEVFLWGALYTLFLTFLICTFGTIIGLILVLIKKSNNKILVKLADIYITIFRAIPALVLLIWTYYALPILFGLKFSAFNSALISLTISLSPFIAGSILSGVNSIPKGQYEAAIIMGMNKIQAMRRIILPQALKQMAPDLVGWYITQLKFTSLASIVGVNELLHRSNILISKTFRPLEIYTTMAVLYLIIVLLITKLSKKYIKINYKKRI